jgi:hypothetical protein
MENLEFERIAIIVQRMLKIVVLINENPSVQMEILRMERRVIIAQRM